MHPMGGISHIAIRRQKKSKTICDVLPAMNGGASYAAEGWRKVPNVV